MKFVIFRYSTAIHAADAHLAPLCGQTNAAKATAVQQVLANEPTCERCRQYLHRQDKNSTESRTRRRFAAARQALREAVTGVSYFEKHTKDKVARLRFMHVLQIEIGKLNDLGRAFLNPPSVVGDSAPQPSTTPTTPPA